MKDEHEKEEEAEEYSILWYVHRGLLMLRSPNINVRANVSEMRQN